MCQGAPADLHLKDVRVATKRRIFSEIESLLRVQYYFTMGSRPIFRTQTAQEFSQLIKPRDKNMTDVTNGEAAAKVEVEGGRTRRTSLPSESSPDAAALDLETEDVGELDSELIKHLRLVEWKAPREPQVETIESSGSDDEADVFAADSVDAAVPQASATPAAQCERVVAAKENQLFRDKMLSDSRDAESARRSSQSPPATSPQDLKMVRPAITIPLLLLLELLHL